MAGSVARCLSLHYLTDKPTKQHQHSKTLVAVHPIGRWLKFWDRKMCPQVRASPALDSLRFIVFSGLRQLRNEKPKKAKILAKCSGEVQKWTFNLWNIKPVERAPFRQTVQNTSWSWWWGLSWTRLFSHGAAGLHYSALEYRDDARCASARMLLTSALRRLLGIRGSRIASAVRAAPHPAGARGPMGARAQHSPPATHPVPSLRDLSLSSAPLLLFLLDSLSYYLRYTCVYIYCDCIHTIRKHILCTYLGAIRAAQLPNFTSANETAGERYRGRFSQKSRKRGCAG